MEKEKFLKLYTLAELSYEKHFEKFKLERKKLYPCNWYVRKNYKKKIEIIADAIKNNTLIVNTSSYIETIEGMR